jgi:hypothetical protein
MRLYDPGVYFQQVKKEDPLDHEPDQASQGKKQEGPERVLQHGDGNDHQGEGGEWEERCNDDKSTAPFSHECNVSMELFLSEGLYGRPAGYPAADPVRDDTTCVGEDPKQEKIGQGLIKFLGPYHEKIHRDHPGKGFRSKEKQQDKAVGEPVDDPVEQAVEVHQVFARKVNKQDHNGIDPDDQKDIPAHIPEETPVLQPRITVCGSYP